jgi:hypothetical protein
MRSALRSRNGICCRDSSMKRELVLEFVVEVFQVVGEAPQFGWIDDGFRHAYPRVLFPTFSLAVMEGVSTLPARPQANVPRAPSLV